MGFVIRHSLGFFIQIFLSLILLYIPFSKESYRFPKKMVMIVLGIVAMVESLLFPFLISGDYVGLFYDVYKAANLYMLCSVVILVGIWLWIIRENIIKKMIVIIFALFYAATQYMVVNLFTVTGDEIYSFRTVLLFLCSAAILFPICAVILFKAVKPYIEKIEPKNMKVEFCLILSITVLYILELIFAFSGSPDIFGPYWTYLVTTFFVTMFVICIFYWVLFRESVHRKIDEEKKREYEIQQMQYEKIVSEIENAKRMRHDSKHHIRVLSDMAQQNNIDEIKEYLAALINETQRQETERFCSNEKLNGILEYYIGWAREIGIKCTVCAVCDDNLPIKQSDLTVLLGNALENAIQSCKESSDKKWIAVNLGKIGGSFAISIENACEKIKNSESYKKADGFLPAAAFISIHKNGGYGLKSIAATAKIYNGDAAFRYDEDKKTFCTRIRLNSDYQQY